MPFVAALEQQLMAEAHAEDRPLAARQLTHRVAKPGLRQRPCGDRECANSGKHHTVARNDHVRVAADHRLCAGDAERTLHAAQIADAVVADADSRHHSVPFVDGTPPPIT